MFAPDGIVEGVSDGKDTRIGRQWYLFFFSVQLVLMFFMTFFPRTCWFAK